MTDWANKVRAAVFGHAPLELTADEAAAAQAALSAPQAPPAPVASTPTPPAPAPVDTAGITAAEKTRWSTVLAHDNAKGKQAAATELLGSTDLPAEKIVAMLPKLGADAAPAAAPPAPKTGAKSDAALAIEAATPKVVVSGAEPANDGAGNEKVESPLKYMQDLAASAGADKAYFGGIRPNTAR